MICKNCRRENPEDALLCMTCKAPLGDSATVRCRSCQTDLPAAARFCFSCGAPVAEEAPARPWIGDSLRRLMPREYVDQLTAARGRIAGERRVITILFVDVHGSVALAENLDPEEVMDIMNGALKTLIEPVLHHEGTLARLMGDAVLAFFGAPIAHEDDPARACRAALEMVEGIRRYSDRLERERGITGFRVRVGINTGLVVVGEVGSDLRVEYTAMGDAVNLAARMESAAEPGSILLTEATARLVRRSFALEEVGPLRVKGKSEPVRASRLLGTVAGQGRTGETHTPLVGKETELGILAKALSDVAKGSGGSLALIGNAGMGKSRLVTEARLSAPAGLTWVEGYCVSYGGGMSHWPVRDVMRGLLGVSGDAPKEETAAALRSILATFPEDLYPYLARLLDIRLDEETEQRMERGDPFLLRDRLLAAFRVFVRSCARRSPLVVVWEDLHWMDSSLADFLEALAAMTDEEPILLLYLFRPEEAKAANIRERLEAVGGKAHLTIELGPLSRQESKELAEQLLRGENLPERARDAILDGAEGNPFFLEEMVGALADTGFSDGEEGEGPDKETLERITLPGTVQGVILSRIDRLPPATKQVLQTASILGRVFPRSLLARLTREESKELDESLDRLHRRGFLHTESADPASAAESMVSFGQAITLDVVYNSLLRRQRRELHRRAGEIIEETHADRGDEVAPVLAHHFEKGAAPAKAFGYLTRAARRAIHVCANREAIAFFRRAASLVEGGGPGLGNAELASAHEGAGDASFLMGDYRSAMREYGQALRRTGDPDRTLPLERKRGQVFEKWGRHEEAKERYEAGLRSMGPGTDPVEAARVYTGLAMVHAHRSRLGEASRMGTIALKMMKSLGDEWGIAQACNNLGVIYCKQESWDLAISNLRRCLSIYEKIGETYGRASCHNNLGLVYHHKKNWEQAIIHYQKSLGLFERLGNRHGLARAYDNLSNVYVDMGDEDQAMDQLKQAAAILAEIGMDGAEFVPEMWQSGAW